MLVKWTDRKMAADERLDRGGSGKMDPHGHRAKKKVEPDMTVKHVLIEYVDEINTVFMCGLELCATRTLR